ncbi:MAG TPA: hypothetical protein VHN77_08920 [Phycisphaerales bacterium]|nr:hypothetical protein [Phycisphaerales bacterium]
MQEGAPSTVDRDHLCIACGYNLRGLPVDSQCPECALSVAESLKGDFLAFASPQYRARIILGMKLFAWGTVLMFVLGLTVAQTVRLISPTAFLNAGVLIAFGIAGLLPWIMVLVGGWMFSSTDIGYNGSDDPVLARTWTRICVVAITSLEVVPLLASWVVPPATIAAVSPLLYACRIAKLAMLTTLLFVSVRCIRWIAMRVPSPVWARRATRHMWLLPALAIVPLTTLILFAVGGGMAPAGGMGVMAVLGVGTFACWIVVVIMYLSLVISVQKEVSHVHAAAANTGRV